MIAYGDNSQTRASYIFYFVIDIRCRKYDGPFRLEYGNIFTRRYRRNCIFNPLRIKQSGDIVHRYDTAVEADDQKVPTENRS